MVERSDPLIGRWMFSVGCSMFKRLSACFMPKLHAIALELSVADVDNPIPIGWL
jgi:hypothetical protein